MTTEQRAKFARTARIVLTTCLLLTSVLSAINHVALFRLKENVDRWLQTSADVAQVSVLAERIASLEQHLDTLHRAPAVPAEARFEEVRVSLDDRLRQLEHSITTVAPASDLEQIRTRLQALETRSTKARRAEQAWPTPAPVPAPHANADTPPFTVLGTEMRGGEQFLTLLPLNSNSLSSVQLLRIGETHGNWRLVRLEDRVATFQIGDRQHRIELP